MNVALIAVPCAEATPYRGGRLTGLEQASDAYLAAGLSDNLSRIGAPVASVARLVLPDDILTADPVLNLGRYNALVAEAVAAGIAGGAAPLLAGGTCNHLIGMLAGLQRAHGASARIGLVWFDAHGDFNTPRTTPSGMLGGMPVATAAGLCHAPWRELAGQAVPLPTDRIVFVDVRNLDPEEAALVHASDAAVVSLHPDRPGARIADAVADLAAKVDIIYLHVDADVLDASLQPNHPTAEPDGPDLAATLAAMEVVTATGKVGAFGVVSVNPTGPDGGISLASGLELLRVGVSGWSGAWADV